MQFYHVAASAALSRRSAFGPPFGHPNSLKIALARALCAQVRAREPQNAKKTSFGEPLAAKGSPNGGHVHDFWSSFSDSWTHGF